MTDTPAPSTSLAERMAAAIADELELVRKGLSGNYLDGVEEGAAEAVRRTIALAAGVVGDKALRIERARGAQGLIMALREVEREIGALDGEERNGNRTLSRRVV